MEQILKMLELLINQGISIKKGLKKVHSISEFSDGSIDYDEQKYERWKEIVKIFLSKNINIETANKFYRMPARWPNKDWYENICGELTRKTAFLISLKEDIEKNPEIWENLLSEDKKSRNEPPLKHKQEIYSLDNKNVWSEIKNDFGMSKYAFGQKVYFVKDVFKRKIIFRDIGHAYLLADKGFSKPALILASGVIEELLRLYLKHKNINPSNNTFDGYIKACEKHGLLKSGISNLSHSFRYFRNIVHLEKEISSKYTISKATAKGAVSSIFTISNDFLK